MVTFSPFLVARVSSEYAKLTGKRLADARQIVEQWLLQEEYHEWVDTATYHEIAEWVCNKVNR